MGALNILAISTFNREGLELYGYQMASSWRDNGAAPLQVYREGWSRELLQYGVREVELLEASDWLGKFRDENRHRTFKDFRWDAVRFSHKVAAICHAARDPSLHFLIWIDGDVLTHSPMSRGDLVRLAPETEWVSWLDRKGCYPETGFLIFNCRHPRHIAGINMLQRLYTSGDIYRLQQFHDCWALQHVVRDLALPAKSLSGDAFTNMHPMINGPLGAWFDHAKGARKRQGGSSRHDLTAPRSEPYWQNRR